MRNGTCRSCGGTVVWLKAKGRWHCYNADFTDHWDVCSANKWKRVVETGTPFSARTDQGRVEGYAGSVHGTKLSKIRKPMSKGKDYVDPHCDCGIPPWDPCKHSRERIAA